LADQSDDLADFAVTMENYVSLKRSLIESQKQCHNLTAELEESRTNCRKLTEEVAFLQDKVEKLLQENRNLRCVGSPVDVPTLTHVNGNTTSRADRRWTTLPGEGNTLVLSQQGVDVSQEFPSPPQDLLSPVSKSAEMVDSHSDNTKTKTIGTRSHSAEVTLTESTPLHHSQHVKAKSIGVTPEIPMPTQDDVVKKTDKITRTLQELFQTAQDNKHDCFINCAEKIHAAVVEMAELFPKTMVSERMLATLRMLTDGSNHLLELCSQSPPELNGVTDYRLHTNKVIQTAYDIAKAAKQLVMLFE
jgi:prophage DNA circulation protein